MRSVVGDTQEEKLTALLIGCDVINEQVRLRTGRHTIVLPSTKGSSSPLRGTDGDQLVSSWPSFISHHHQLFDQLMIGETFRRSLLDNTQLFLPGRQPSRCVEHNLNILWRIFRVIKMKKPFAFSKSVGTFFFFFF